MELLRALALLAEPPGSSHLRVAGLLGLDPPDEAGYTETFLFQLPPYAAVHLGPEGMLGGEAQDRVAGFWRALGWEPPPEPDHLGTLVALYASIGDDDASHAAPAGRVRAALLWEHLLPWLPAYLAAVSAAAPPPYPNWARLLNEALQAEATSTPPPPTLPLHLREAPPLPDPRNDGPDTFLSGLLAPTRAGWTLTHATLRRAAADLGLGLRAGERRFVLRALLSQDPPAVLDWLATESVRVATTAWEPWSPIAGPIADFWTNRARHSSELLRDLGTHAAIQPNTATA